MDLKSLVLNTLEQYDYATYGLRVVDEDGALLDGETLGDSRVWVDGEPTDEYLDGTCAIFVSKRTIDHALRLINNYVGKTVLIVGCDKCVYEHGQDEGEVILKEPIVLAYYTR